MHKKRSFVLILVLLTLFMVSSTSSAVSTSEDDSGNTIFLRSTTINTDILSEDDGHDITVSSDLIEETGYDTELYYIIQFTGPVFEEQKEEITRSGAVLFDYLPDNAFIVRTNSSVRSQISSLDFVKWIGEYQASYKYESAITVAANQLMSESEKEKADLLVMLFDASDSSRIAEETGEIGGTVIENSNNILRIKIVRSRIDHLAAINGISWIEEYREPVLSNDVAATIIGVTPVHNTHRLNGSGQIVAVCDTGVDTGVDDESMHADIRGRILNFVYLSDDGAADTNGHGTHVVGSIIGNGANSGGQYKGMAPEAGLVFEEFLNSDGSLSLPYYINESVFQPAYNLGAKIHSNSWGYQDNYGNYSIYSQQVDQFMWENPDMLILFAAGNYGVDQNKDGVVDQNSIQDPATAKNCVAVGSSESNRSSFVTWGSSYGLPISNDKRADNIEGMAATSSRGPTNDGRIKPDVVAPGTYIMSTKSSLTGSGYYTYMSGTSMATPIVAGSAALIRQYYNDTEGYSNPSAALIKATLINGAYDMTPGQYGTGSTQEITGRPDYSQGWGRVDVENSLFSQYPDVIAYFDKKTIDDTGDSWEFDCDYIQEGEPLHATLAWTDYPGSVAAAVTLVNNLDLTIIGPDDTYYGNGVPDTINNVEGLEIDETVAGDYNIRVDGTNVPEGPQDFSLVLSFTCDNNEFPANGSSTDNSTTVVSTDVVHPGGVDQSSIQMTISGSSVEFNSVSVDGGYRIYYDTSAPYQNGEYNVSVSAQTVNGQQLSYGWKFNVEATITSFNFEDFDPVVIGVINEESNTITLTAPYGTDVTALVPTITHTGESISPNTGVAQNFNSPVTYTVTAEDGTTQQYTVAVNVALNSAKQISSFKFNGLDLVVTGTINEDAKTVTLIVPYGTEVTALVPTITHSGKSINPNSGVAQDFTDQVTYTVTAEDGTTQQYTVTVNVALNPAKAITSFKLNGLNPAVTGTIDENAKTVTLNVPYGTDVTALVPTITHTGKSINPNSGVAQDFTNPVAYTVTAEDGSTQQYTVTVDVALNPAKAITSFKFNGLDPAVTGTIDETTKTVTLNLPYGTDVTALVPTITHTGASISPNTGVAQNFNSPVTYTVTAEDGTTQQYTVAVNVALNSAKQISSFNFNGLDPVVTGTINEDAKTVTLNVPYGTDITALVPTITHSGKSINPNSGVAQDFTDQVTYTVTAEDGKTQQYTVTINVALNPAKAITSFKLNGLNPAVTGTIDENAKTVTLNVPYGTDVTALVPTITHTGKSINPNSGIAQDFTSPVTYTVTAEDGSTQQYTVTVDVALNPAKAITSFKFNGLDPVVTGTINEDAKTVTLDVPYGTEVTELVPTITHTGASISPNTGVIQDFTNPVTYTVTSEDGTTQQYTVTVTITPPDTTKEITSFNFEEFNPIVIGVVNETAKKVTLTVPYGTNVAALVPTIAHTGESISPESGVTQNFTDLMYYNVTAEDGTTQKYVVTVLVRPNTISPPTTSSSSSGGGGGGGGTTGEEYENIETKDVSSLFVGKDTVVRFNFENPDIDIMYVEYTSLKNAGTVSVTIESLKDKSSFADSLPAGEIYRNVNIWVGKTGYAINANLADPVIAFRVESKWIREEGIDETSIALNRYSDGSWNRLSTEIVDSDEDFLYFEASTPGFSPFAITGNKVQEEIKLDDSPETLYSTEDAENDENSSAGQNNESEAQKTLNSISSLISGLIICFACFLVRRQ